MTKLYFTVAEAAKYVGLSRRTLYHWIAEGKAKPIKIPGWRKMLFDIQELERLKQLAHDLSRGYRQGTIG